jgi:hypothetical protein
MSIIPLQINSQRNNKADSGNFTALAWMCVTLARVSNFFAQRIAILAEGGRRGVMH